MGKIFGSFFVLILSACATYQNEVFRLEQGDTVVCQRYTQEPCGMHLMGCGDDSSVEFECVKNVNYTGSKK